MLNDLWAASWNSSVVASACSGRDGYIWIYVMERHGAHQVGRTRDDRDTRYWAGGCPMSLWWLLWDIARVSPKFWDES